MEEEEEGGKWKIRKDGSEKNEKWEDKSKRRQTDKGI